MSPPFVQKLYSEGEGNLAGGAGGSSSPSVGKKRKSSPSPRSSPMLASTSFIFLNAISVFYNP